MVEVGSCTIDAVNSLKSISSTSSSSLLSLFSEEGEVESRSSIFRNICSTRLAVGT